MAEDRRPEIVAPTTPQKFAETPPPPSAAADYTTFTLTTVMQLQNAVGGLTNAVQSLTKHSEEQGKKVDHLSHVIYAAAAVVSVLTAIGVFILSKVSDLLVDVIRKSLAG